MQVVVPLIEGRYATVPGKEGRLLLGFSKSGWGALSLILLNPDFFGYAASWDAPLSWSTEAMRGQFGSGQQYGSLENYRHHHPVLAARRNPEPFRARKRLVVLGRSFWGKDNRLYHTILDELGILHHFDDELRTPHDWHPGWVGPALEALVGLAAAAPPAAPTPVPESIPAQGATP
jgi:enterochelin esterase-like enzyme